MTHIYFATGFFRTYIRHRKATKGESMADDSTNSSSAPSSLDPAKFIQAIGELIQSLPNEQKLVGGVLLGIIAVLIPAIFSVSSEQSRLLLWFATIGLVLFILLLMYAFIWYRDHKLNKAKEVEKMNQQLLEDLETLQRSGSEELTELRSRLTSSMERGLEYLSEIEKNLVPLENQIRELRQKETYDVDIQALTQQMTSLVILIKEKKQDFSSHFTTMQDAENLLRPEFQSKASDSVIAMREARRAEESQ